MKTSYPFFNFQLSYLIKYVAIGFISFCLSACQVGPDGQSGLTKTLGALVTILDAADGKMDTTATANTINGIPSNSLAASNLGNLPNPSSEQTAREGLKGEYQNFMILCTQHRYPAGCRLAEKTIERDNDRRKWQMVLDQYGAEQTSLRRIAENPHIFSPGKRIYGRANFVKMLNATTGLFASPDQTYKTAETWSTRYYTTEEGVRFVIANLKPSFISTLRKDDGYFLVLETSHTKNDLVIFNYIDSRTCKEVGADGTLGMCWYVGF